METLHYFVQKRHVESLSEQNSPAATFTYAPILKIRHNIVLPSTTAFPKWILPTMICSRIVYALLTFSVRHSHTSAIQLILRSLVDILMVPNEKRKL
jgi:hypothetical protein